jgi:hypothetical protein
MKESEMNTTIIWIVVKYWRGGRREDVAAFTKEDAAREVAGRLVGSPDESMIALRTISLDPSEEEIFQMRERVDNTAFPCD